MSTKPLYWKCTCGWVGTAVQMNKPEYTCPKCNKFKSMSPCILTMYKKEPIVNMELCV